MSNECTCLYGEEGESPEFYNDRWVNARKTHRCYECRCEIAIGTRYYRVSGKWDGDTQTFHICDNCQNIAASLYCESSYSLGQLWEDVEEQIFAETGLTIACIDKLTTATAKEKLQRAYVEWLAR